MAQLVPERISVVVPVKDNPEGVASFLAHFFERVPAAERPLEILFVDDGSRERLALPDAPRPAGTRVRLVRSPVTRGRSGARNLGLRLALGDWILFVDSDCVPGPGVVGGYLQAARPDRAAYAGATRSLGTDPLSRFYDEERVFLPPPTPEGDPMYLITANAMVRKDVLLAMNGFDEALFSGEDLDLSFRLLGRHRLGYALDSVVEHDMGDGFLGFVERFHRYGRGNRLLEDKYAAAPGEPRREKFRPFLRPVNGLESSFNRLMVFARYLCELWGYRGWSLAELHAGLDAACPEAVAAADAYFLLAGLAGELEAAAGRGEAGVRDMPLARAYGFATLLLSLLGRRLPGLEEALAPRLLALQPRLLA